MPLIDEAVIDPRKSVDELRVQFDGMVLYDHVLAGADGVVNTIRELDEMGVIRAVTLHADIP